MIKIMYYTHEWDYAGTARSQERILTSLDRKIFDPYIFYWGGSTNNSRLGIIKNIIGEDHCIKFERAQEKRQPFYTPINTNFAKLAKEIGFDIIHFKRSGYTEWPFIDRLAKLQIETNVFGDIDTSTFLDKSMCVSNYVLNKRGGADAVIYNPIPIPKLYGKDLREELSIPKDAIVLGRIGRPTAYFPWGVMAFKELLKIHNNLYYIIIAPQSEIEDQKNLIKIEETIDDEYIEKFNRTIDIFLHYRKDGETYGTAIAHAMSYGKPIISHTSNNGDNGHIEIVGDGGFVSSTYDNYLYSLNLLIEDFEYRKVIGRNAFEKAKLYYITDIVEKTQNLYLKWLGEI